MAKEQFVRSKPHVNVNSSTGVLVDTSGELVVTGSGSEQQNDPEANVIIQIIGPASSSPQRAVVAFPIDEHFHYTPLPDAPVARIDWQLDLLPREVSGGDVCVTLALVQGDAFYAASAGEVVGAGQTWLRIADTIMRPDDFLALDGGFGRPDFAQPFHFGYAFAAEYSTPGLQVEVELDNMQVEITAIPEPASLLLIGSLGASLLLMRWRSQPA